MSDPSRPFRPFAYLPLVVSAICAVLAVNMALTDPRRLLPLGLIVVLTFLPAALARWRMRRLLISGDVKRVLGTWEGSVDRVMHAETMAPLMAATAYASYGWVEAARNALARAAKGPAWDAALEQRLFIETLLDTFEGERDSAIEKARVLQQMPAPAAGPLVRKRVASLRQGLGALARAFAHRSGPADGDALARAASASPLVHWAMRYASAIVAVDQGKAEAVKGLLAGAPEWPKESAFRVFHEELLSRIPAAAVT